MSDFTSEFIDEPINEPVNQLSGQSTHQLSFSRRGFLGLAASAVAAGVMNISFGPTSHAYADEGSEQKFDIDVVGKEEFGVVVRDFDTKELLENVKVTIKSWYSETTLEGRTERKPNGKVFLILNIKDLAEPKQNNGGRYKFWGSLKLELDGYRVFETGMIRMVGSSHAEVGSKKLDSNPYVRMFTFNEFDIQYPATPEVFALGKTNKEKHTLAWRVAANEGSDVTVSYYCDGFWDKKTAKVSGGYAEISFMYDFLNDNNLTWKFEPGDQIYAVIEANGKKFKVVARMGVERIRGVDEKSTGEMGLKPGFLTSYILPDEGEEISQDMLIAEGEQGKLGVKFTLPEKIPGIGGSVIELETPNLPVLYDLDPMGLAMIGVGVSTKRVTKKGQTDPSKWKYDSWKSLQDQFDETAGDWMDAWDAYLSNTQHPDPNNPDVNRWNKASRWNVLWKLTLELSAAVMLSAMWKAGDSKWKGELKGSISFGLKYQHSQQLALGPVPACIIFDFGANATVSGALNVTFTGLFRDVEWTSSKTGFGFNVKISLYVTFAAGIKGVATLGIRGGGYLSFGIGMYIPPREGLPGYHLTLGAGAGFDFVVQVFLVKWSGRIYGNDWPDLVDNWKSSSSGGELGDGWDPTNPDWYGNAGENAESALPINSELGFGKGDGLGYTMPDSEAFQQDGDGMATLIGATMLDGDNPDQYQLVKSTELAKTCEMKGSSPRSAEDADNTAIAAGEAWDPSEEEGYDPAVAKYQYDPNELIFDWAYDIEGIDGNGCLDVSYTASQIGVGGVSERGVKPSNETLLINGIFSDGRTKLVSDRNGNLFMFRLLVVEYPEKGNGADQTIYRSRVTYAMYKSGKFQKPQVIEFGIYKNDRSLVRRDLYDYDFDVKPLPSGFTCTFAVALTCGARPSADAATLHEVENNMAFITLQLAPMGDSLSVWRHEEFTDFVEREHSDQKKHLVLLPRVTVLEGREGVAEKSVAFSMIQSFERLGTRTWAVWVGSYGVTAKTVWAMNPHEEWADYWRELTGLIPTALETFDLSDSPVVYNQSSLPLGMAITFGSTKEVTDEKGKKHIVPVHRSVLDAFNDDLNQIYWPASMPGDDNSVGLPVVWPKHGSVVVNKGGTLITIDSKGAEEQIGLEKLEIQQFSFSEDGKTIYYTKMDDGPYADTIAPDGTRTKTHEPQYNIMACRCYKDEDGNERFRSPYIFGEVSRAVDAMFETTFNGHSAFLYAHATKMAESKADIYFAAIPHVKAATLIKVASANVLVDAGSTAKMLVFARNDGNICLQAMKLDVYTVDESGNRTLYKTLPVDCSKDSAVYHEGDLDIQNPELSSQVAALSDEADDAALNAARAGAFIPGTERCFITTMDIDPNWRGNVKLVGVLEGGGLEPCRILGYAEPEEIIGVEGADGGVALAYTQPEAMWPPMELGVNDVATIDPNNYEASDNPYEFEDGPQPAPDPTKPKPLAKTGDSLGGIGALGVAAALGAAGLAAYSARREQIEAEQEAE